MAAEVRIFPAGVVPIVQGIGMAVHAYKKGNKSRLVGY